MPGANSLLDCRLNFPSWPIESIVEWPQSRENTTASPNSALRMAGEASHSDSLAAIGGALVEISIEAICMDGREQPGR